MRAIGLVLMAALAAAPGGASAQVAATTAEATSAGQFITTLSDKVFAVLKESQSKAAIKTKFRSLLKDNFAVDTAGAKLIRRYRNQITPASSRRIRRRCPTISSTSTPTG